MSEHYFSEAPAGEWKPREIEVTLAGASRQVVTAGGVFSPEHLDQGTAVLLRWLENQAAGEVTSDFGPILDLGCGWGPIALAAALRHPETAVWAVDVNARARELAELNARALGLGNIRVASPEEVPEDLRFAAIHSNPPIRVGKGVLHEILRQWLPRLIPGGAAQLVVAKHLGAESLQRWIAAELPEFEVRRATRDRGFHVIEAVR